MRELYSSRCNESYILIDYYERTEEGLWALLDFEEERRERTVEGGIFLSGEVQPQSLPAEYLSPHAEITIQSNRRPAQRETTPSNRTPHSPAQGNPSEPLDRSKQIPHIELPKLTTPIKYKEGETTSYFKTELDAVENPLIVGSTRDTI
jgi:hypothetical protein